MAYDDDLPRPYEIGWRPKPRTTSSAFREGYIAGVADTRAEAVKRTCATCQHQQPNPYTGVNDAVCRLTQMSDGVHVTVTYVPCRVLGNTCGSWKQKNGDTQ